jgi:hypothetical protein
VVSLLETRDVFLAPDVSPDEAAQAFARASAIGRSWIIRTIAGERIRRPEADELISLVADSNTRSVLLSGLDPVRWTV